MVSLPPPRPAPGPVLPGLTCEFTLPFTDTRGSDDTHVSLPPSLMCEDRTITADGRPGLHPEVTAAPPGRYKKQTLPPAWQRTKMPPNSFIKPTPALWLQRDGQKGKRIEAPPCTPTSGCKVAGRQGARHVHFEGADTHRQTQAAVRFSA